MKRIIEAGYDAIAEHYLTWSAQIADDPRLHYLDQFDSRLPDGAKVLELGCGAGVPVTRQLAERHDVLGVDLSQQQLGLARAHVPHARFEKADMTALDFPDGTFDGIAAFYSILHVPRAEQPGLIAKIARWLRRGGLFLASLGTGTPDVTETWLGVEMFFGSNTPAENRELLAGHMEIVIDDLVTMHEPDPATFHWVLTLGSHLRVRSEGGAVPTYRRHSSAVRSRPADVQAARTQFSSARSQRNSGVSEIAVTRLRSSAKAMPIRPNRPRSSVTGTWPTGSPVTRSVTTSTKSRRSWVTSVVPGLAAIPAR